MNDGGCRNKQPLVLYDTTFKHYFVHKIGTEAASHTETTEGQRRFAYHRELYQETSCDGHHRGWLPYRPLRRIQRWARRLLTQPRSQRVASRAGKSFGFSSVTGTVKQSPLVFCSGGNRANGKREDGGIRLAIPIKRPQPSLSSVRIVTPVSSP